MHTINENKYLVTKKNRSINKNKIELEIKTTGVPSIHSSGKAERAHNLKNKPN